jgi:hypothetical protein
LAWKELKIVDRRKSEGEKKYTSGKKPNWVCCSKKVLGLKMFLFGPTTGSDFALQKDVDDGEAV